ncbi:sensor histidine kinase [Chiayiivirga flava]|uniref:histidine kinase n=1 Tax=Chiayiivirga flava TaxID=659595 RepID=A0A7W8D5U9_9GAMM|nr:ATP-binding protein [Chiayiivirga flava]MBB5207257.1 signal transduction histidine kinase [Chiayiivirga flava]
MTRTAAQRIAALFNDRFASRFVALGAAAFATVLVPYLLTRSWSDEALEAEHWARHTAEVSDSTSQLMFHLRNMEAATYGLLAGVQAPSLRTRYDSSRAAVDPLLERIRSMTRDNAEQQVRIGQVKATLDQRLPYLDAAVTQTDPAERAASLGQLERMLNEGSVGDVVGELAAAEDRLLIERTRHAARQRDNVRWLQTLSLVAQLLLLGGIAWVAERALRRRRVAEHRSSDADTRSRAIVDSVREPIALLDGGLRVVMHNTAFVEFYGEPDAGPQGDLRELGGGAWHDPTLAQRLVDVVTRDREIWDYELRQRTVDGVQRQVLVNAKRIALPDDTDTAVLLTVNDVTPQKLAERQALELNRQLEGKVAQISEVNRELEAFSYSVSHDLRAPLRHIAGFAEKLRGHLDPSVLDDERARHYLDVISSSAARMAVLIDDLLLYSRLGRHAMRVHAVDMDKLVREVREMLSSSRAEGRIEWRIDALPTVPGDETMLRQVWQNLLSNAIKYSSQREVAKIEIGYRLDGAMHQFRVRDNGVGFDMEYAGKLFGVFQRLHKASEFPGSGIGLANVRRIVSRHGGRVWADAEIGNGASFHFTLPVRQDHSANARDVTTENTQ